MLEYVLNAPWAVYNSALDLAFTFCSHRASKSASSESIKPLKSFHDHAQSPAPVHDPLGSQKYVGPFCSFP